VRVMHREVGAAAEEDLQGGHGDYELTKEWRMCVNFCVAS